MRFGVMCTGTFFQRWQADAIMALKRHGHQPVLLISDAREVPQKSLFSRIIRKRWKTILYSVLENRVFQPGAKRRVSLAAELSGIDQLNCIVDRKGFSEYFRQEHIDVILSHKLDFILRFGFNILHGGILDSAVYGIWSFHHDDEMKYRGGPPGFWEIYNGDPVSGAILQRLTPKLDGGIILRKGYLQTVKHSWKGNLEQLLTVSAAWPALVADEISGLSKGSELLARKFSLTEARIYKVPGNLQMVFFLLKLLRNRLAFYYNEFFMAEQWNVGVVEKPVHEVALRSEPLKDQEITWLFPTRKHTYYADPFGFIEGKLLHVFVEVYSYKAMNGRISGYDFPIDPVRVGGPRQGGGTPSGWGDPVRVEGPRQGGESGHLSYPYIAEHQGEIYCLPESSASGRLTLYRYDRQQSLFFMEKILLDNIEAVDPTLLNYQGIWWLFFTERRFSNTHLFLYFSDQITGEFKPHPLNPVKIDVRSARPAGAPFVHEGNLYRPAQDCSITYGGRVVINKVGKITPEIYTEEVIGAIEPDGDSRYRNGLHTLSQAGDLTLIDGKHYRANWYYFVTQCRQRFSAKGKNRV